MNDDIFHTYSSTFGELQVPCSFWEYRKNEGARCEWVIDSRSCAPIINFQPKSPMSNDEIDKPSFMKINKISFVLRKSFKQTKRNVVEIFGSPLKSWLDSSFKWNISANKREYRWAENLNISKNFHFLKRQLSVPPLLYVGILGTDFDCNLLWTEF